MASLRSTILLFVFSMLSPAQAGRAGLSGSVVDPQELGIGGAAVKLTDTATGAARETITDAAGAFTFAALPPATYKLEVAQNRFRGAEVTNLVLNANDQRSVRVPMALASGQDSVTVSSDLPLVSESPAVATSIERQFFETQPLNGRSFQSLISLSPGVVPTQANLVTPGQFSVNGQRASANYYTVDGVSANFATSASVTPYENGGGVPSFSALGSTNSLASVDAVQEFTIQTSTYAAEYGRQPGGQIAIVTRSGGNQFHGTLFHYLRNSVMDASNFFANAAGLPKPAIKLNDFGGVLGGPIVPNKTFFFFSYEGLRLRQPFVTAPLQVPSTAARAAATGPIQEILEAFPLPTGPAFANDATAAPYQASFSNASTLNATSFRLDHHFNQRWSVFGRYNYSPSENLERARFCAASCVSATRSRAETLTTGATAVLSATLTNDLRFNFSRGKTGLSYFIDTFGGAKIPSAAALYPNFTDAQKGYMYIQVDGVGDNTISDGLFVNNRQRQWNIVDTLAWTRGAHSLKFGADYRRLEPISDSGSYRRQFNPNSIALLTQGFSANAVIIAPEVALEPRYTNFSAFAQDTWRLSSRVTLTAGLRWDLNPAPKEANGRDPFVVYGDTASTLAIQPRGARFYDTDYRGFAPRLGISAQPLRKWGTVVRGGVGVFYDLGTSFLGNAYNTSLFPNARQTSFTRIGYTDPAFAAQPPAVNLNPPFPRLFSYQRDARLPYTIQYNFSVEQPFGASNTVSLTYAGASGRRQSRVASYRNPSPRFTRVDAVTNNAESNYNSLQAQYRRRLSAGLQVLASYTWAKSLDTVSEESINNFQLPANTRFDPRADYGPSTFDIRHAFNAAASYNLPKKYFLGGFGLDGIIRSQTAPPVNITSNRDPFGLGLANIARPDVLAGQPLYIESEAFAGGRRFNAAAFDSATPLAQGRQGSLGRNVLRAFPLTQVDLSARRTFQITERFGLQVRADAFNVFNHANFAAPNGVLTNANFGRATQMLGSGLGGLSSLFQVGGPRSVQVALKLQF